MKNILIKSFLFSFFIVITLNTAFANVEEINKIKNQLESIESLFKANAMDEEEYDDEDDYDQENDDYEDEDEENGSEEDEEEWDRYSDFYDDERWNRERHGDKGLKLCRFGDNKQFYATLDTWETEVICQENVKSDKVSLRQSSQRVTL